jgi:hypothetical protein
MPGPKVWTGDSGSGAASKVANVSGNDATSYQEEETTCASSLHRREHARDFSY